MAARGCRHFGNDECGFDPIERLMIGVGENDLDGVRPSGQTDEDNRLPARVGPMPWRAIDSDMDITDARLDRECFGAEHRFDPKIDQSTTAIRRAHLAANRTANGSMPGREYVLLLPLRHRLPES